MRARFHVPLVMAVLALASAPALAQRASLADRVAALEARAGNNQANVDLLNQVNQLRTEIQALRAQVEELQQKNDQLQNASKAQYLDLDDRLNRLEGSAPAAKPATPTTAPPRTSTTTPATPTVQDKPPSVYGDPGALAQGSGERGAYDAAFNALKAGQYAQSAELFQTFLDQYPNGSYTPNALYWLGESYYVTQNYQLAQTQFQALLDRYPTHDKTPGAMLKVGLSQYGLRQYEAAERTLSEVVNRYPGTDAARTAADRLSAMQLGNFRQR